MGGNAGGTVVRAFRFGAFPDPIDPVAGMPKLVSNYRCGGSAGIACLTATRAPSSRLTPSDVNARRSGHLRRAEFTRSAESPVYHGAPADPSAPKNLLMASPYLQAALEAAETAATVIRKAYRQNFSVDYKPDASPVTEIDIAAETAIKRVLKRYFPGHGFYGEELGREAGDNQHLWLIDPIDGTKSFVRGYPMFSTQIALMRGGELILGVSSAPSWNGGLGETVIAEAGQGAWLDDQRLFVSATDSIEKTTLSTGNLARLARTPAWGRLGALIPRLHRIRGYGDFLHYHLLASGRIDAVVESDVNILDIAALSVIVREAGGVFTDLEGKPLSLATTSVLATTPALHSKLLDELHFTPPP
jgi:histidinol-phosphatase